MKGLVTKSRFTPGLPNGKDVHFQIGETVQYRLLSGKMVDVKISTVLMQHANGAYGYEGVFSDDRMTGFADELRIVNWKGKI